MRDKLVPILRTRLTRSKCGLEQQKKTHKMNENHVNIDGPKNISVEQDCPYM